MEKKKEEMRALGGFRPEVSRELCFGEMALRS